MIHSFQSINSFIFSIETEIINILYDYGLLSKFDKNVKKIIFYTFVKKLDECLSDSDLLFYHNGKLSDDHELFLHYDRSKIDKFVNKICQNIKKNTNRLFFLNKKITLPSKSFINELDGSVIDEIFLLKERKSVDPKLLKEFLNKNHLKDLFNNLSKKVC